MDRSGAYFWKGRVFCHCGLCRIMSWGNEIQPRRNIVAAFLNKHFSGRTEPEFL